MTTLHALSSMLQAEEKVEQPKCCSWCNKFYNSRGEYVAAPFIAVNVSHGICWRCYLTKKAEIEAMIR